MEICLSQLSELDTYLIIFADFVHAVVLSSGLHPMTCSNVVDKILTTMH